VVAPFVTEPELTVSFLAALRLVAPARWPDSVQAEFVELLGDGPAARERQLAPARLAFLEWEADIVTPDFNQLDASLSQGVNEAPDGGIVELGRAQDGSGRLDRFDLTEILEQIDWHCARNSDLVR
jgi:hypothetical protein